MSSIPLLSMSTVWNTFRSTSRCAFRSSIQVCHHVMRYVALASRHAYRSAHLEDHIQHSVQVDLHTRG